MGRQGDLICDESDATLHFHPHVFEILLLVALNRVQIRFQVLQCAHEIRGKTFGLIAPLIAIDFSGFYTFFQGRYVLFELVEFSAQDRIVCSLLFMTLLGLFGKRGELVGLQNALSRF
mmetsp:Transcript_28843/g.38467  ORF Transcript_28843/g.38467 Transcript_28843/m.38467 type:complete len:118 (-) Transcript_28843:752-1105(-)